MPSSTFHCFLFSIVALALLLGASRTASACSCGIQPTVLDAFEEADEVIIGSVISVDKVGDSEKTTEENERSNVPDARSATVIVEKVFKGTLKVRDEIAFGQGDGSNCIWTFTEGFIGEQILFYLKRPERLWYVSVCGRSRGLKAASEDMLYLENMNKLRGKTRISGQLGGGFENPHLDVAGKKVKIIGQKKTYVATTNKDGVFEIYDLPPGKYSVEPDIPPGWKINAYHLRYSPSVEPTDFLRLQTKSLKRVEITLQPKKHAGLDLVLDVDNRVRGRVIGPKGKPLRDVCVYLWRPGQEAWGPSDCTNEEGRFDITSVPQGEYVLVANQNGRPSSREPFPKIFYPSVAERERAAKIYVNPGDIIENIDVVVPKVEETITIEGVLRFSDGRPANDMAVKFKATDGNENLNGDVRADTDKTGRFKLTVLKGLTGELAGEEYMNPRRYGECNNVDELLAKNEKNDGYARSNVIKLNTEQNRYNVELTFPFVRCDAKQ